MLCVAEGRPLPGQTCPIDMPDDFFRVRLVCVLLDTVGMCFDRGSQLKKLDNFLTFFQLYIHCKEPLPMDVEFMVNDSFEAVRPKMVLYKSFEEAAVAVDEMFSVALQNAGSESRSGCLLQLTAHRHLPQSQLEMAKLVMIAGRRVVVRTMKKRRCAVKTRMRTMNRPNWSLPCVSYVSTVGRSAERLSRSMNVRRPPRPSSSSPRLPTRTSDPLKMTMRSSLRSSPSLSPIPLAMRARSTRRLHWRCGTRHFHPRLCVRNGMRRSRKTAKEAPRAPKILAS